MLPFINGIPNMNNCDKKILIVDDEELNRELLTVMLEHEGYNIKTASDGESALKSVMLDPPDLILLDVMMPNMDGNEVVNTLKGDLNTKSIPVIMVTALDNKEAKLAALKSGAEDFLTKPVDRAELLLRVRNMLRLKSYNDLLSNYNEALEAKVEVRTAELETAYKDTIITMVHAAEFKDEDTGAHVKRIGGQTGYK